MLGLGGREKGLLRRLRSVGPIVHASTSLTEQRRFYRRWLPWSGGDGEAKGRGRRGVRGRGRQGTEAGRQIHIVTVTDKNAVSKSSSRRRRRRQPFNNAIIYHHNHNSFVKKKRHSTSSVVRSFDVSSCAKSRSSAIGVLFAHFKKSSESDGGSAHTLEF